MKLDLMLVFKLDNIIQGIWKPHIFDGVLFELVSSLTILPEGMETSWTKLDLSSSSCLITLLEGLDISHLLTKLEFKFMFDNPI
jgi:hypothetical protein